jgi:hypothetical protein
VRQLAAAFLNLRDLIPRRPSGAGFIYVPFLITFSFCAIPIAVVIWVIIVLKPETEGSQPMDAVTRIVALGASNLTRGFHTVVSTARSAWGPQTQVLAALGHGRSYGASSRVLFRTLPGILESGLWRALEVQPSLPTRALVTDVGNDILYGFSAEQILAWVEEAIRRLQRSTQDIILTDLPAASIRNLSQKKFLLFRSILFPACRLSLDKALAAVAQVNEGLGKLAASHDLKFFRLKPSWYGMDPIHIRPKLWRSAWQEILDAPSTDGSGRGRMTEGLRLYFMAPERRWMFGIERCVPQTGVRLVRGGCVQLY